MRAQLCQIRDFVSRRHLQNWAARIVSDRRHWQTCFNGDFSTYGSAWYTEIEEGCPARYQANANLWNARLQKFPNLKAYVAGIADLLPRSVPVVPRRAVLGPYWNDYGFTVYERNGQSGVAHTDLEGLIPYPDSMFDPNTEAYSATLAVECPAEGGGLRIDPRKRRLGHYVPPPTRKGWKLYRYYPGTLTLFDSFLPHSIEGFQLSRAHPRRIVLAVHFLYRESPYPHYQYWV
jgi:hypothetical protein